jgi:hypothetical protein
MNAPDCSACGCPDLTFEGRLGSMDSFRCRSCGQWTQQETDAEPYECSWCGYDGCDEDGACNACGQRGDA